MNREKVVGVNIQLPAAKMQKIRDVAKAERRSLTKQIEFILEEWYKDRMEEQK